MSIGIDRRARSRRPKSGFRAMFGKAPDAATVADRLGKLAKRMLRDTLVDATTKGGKFVVRIAAHPAAPKIKLTVERDGDISVKAVTASVGPGYHAAIVDLLAPVFDELDFEWAPTETPDYIDHRDLAQLQARFVDDLADRIARRGDDQLRLAMPAHLAFRIDHPVLTAMGPRDDAWCAAVIADPRKGADAFAWWEPNEEGALERSRALVKMWLEVPWREPLDAAERKLMKSVDAELRAAWGANPNLELPWADWAELLEFLEIDDARAAKVRKRAGDRTATIGYRRYDIEVEASGEWSLVLPGSFMSWWDRDGERFFATDGERAIELTTLTSTTSPSMNESANADEWGKASVALVEVAAARHPVIATFSDGARAGRAEAYDEDGMHVVHGLMACAPHVAILTCKGDATDEAWALDTWRSLRNAVETGGAGGGEATDE